MTDAITEALDMPRANLAVSVEQPNGTLKNDWAAKHSHQSTLVQHCLFWDRDNDGVIWPLDTYVGFKQLGYNIFWAVLSVLMYVRSLLLRNVERTLRRRDGNSIHSGFSYWTSPSWIPDPAFRIYLPQIHRAKHGSDTGTYDTEVSN